MSCRPRCLSAVATSLLAVGLAASLPAQSASSQTYFLASAEIGSGTSAQTSQYVVDASLGSGVSTDRAASGSYAFTGGYVGTLGTATTGFPWLSGVTPRFATMRSGSPMSVYGTELNLGMSATLSVGGQPAPVGTRTNATITTTLPPQPVPGWQPVEVSTAFGTTTVAQGIGVLPMIEAVEPVASGQLGQLTYRGRTGDLMVWAFALSLAPAPIPLVGLGYGLALDPGTLAVAPATGVTDPNGTLVLTITPVVVTTAIYVQGIVLSQDPGYAPGAFTNAIRIF